MQTRHLSMLRKMLAAALLLFSCTLRANAQQTVVTDSGIVVSTARPSGAITTTYDKILTNPTVLFNGGQKVISVDISFLPKGKDYYGPFTATGNKFPYKAINALKKIKADEVPVTQMFLEGIVIKEGSGTRRLNGSVVITLTP